ncbi:hypothetical protein LTR17_014103 [Elasticomyces elasticus]|nr:hypothetical protein LTR17_014103 [Elasticomyces elasticus]
MKTRAKKPSAAPKPAPTSTEPKHVLPPPSPNPPHLFILPRNAGPEARILSLPHPATGKSTRFFVDPERGVYEFTRVAAAKKSCRSVLLAAEEALDDGEGYVLKEAEVFVATALDGVFALLPAFCTGEEWGTFYDRLFSSEDGEDGGRYTHLRSVFQASDAGRGLEKRMEAGMRGVCDMIEMGDEISYKLNTTKLAHLLFGKAERMVGKGLPASMAEHFVRLPLQAPELSVKREDSTLSIMVDEASPTTITTNPPGEPEELKHLLRLRTALAYLCSNYIPPTLVPKLQEHFNILADFAPLDVRLSEIAKLKSEALALRSLTDNISRKRRGDLDDDDANARAETKKRLKMEEEARKKNVSAGVKSNSRSSPDYSSKNLQQEFQAFENELAHNSTKMTTMTTSEDKIYLQIHYADTYVQPLLIAALRARLPPELLVFLNENEAPPTPNAKLLQWRQYESIDFEHLLAHPGTSLANSYVIRKALIRKHYLSTTVSHWLTKHPDSVLKDHVKGGVEFEVDYAEFLDDALVEAWELKDSWGRNGGLVEGEGEGREWWILKPGMSERGQGIRLFSSEEELTAIFEEWDPPSDDEDEEDGEGEATHSGDEDGTDGTGGGNGIMTSQLRHFVAQPYIHPPLLLPPPHEAAGRKFHIRTYVLAVGALKVYVYRPMLALFAGHQYQAPTTSNTSPSHLNAHLTNTCLQTGEREGSVHAFWSLPSTLPGLKAEDWRRDVFDQICAITGETFEAAARTMGIHFQPLPNAFEIFGLDFLVDAGGGVWLLEVNAFPDFAQTGKELQGVVRGLMEEVVEVGVRPFWGLESRGVEEMIGVLDLDLGRR